MFWLELYIRSNASLKKEKQRKKALDNQEIKDQAKFYTVTDAESKGRGT